MAAPPEGWPTLESAITDDILRWNTVGGFLNATLVLGSRGPFISRALVVRAGIPRHDYGYDHGCVRSIGSRGTGQRRQSPNRLDGEIGSECPGSLRDSVSASRTIQG